MTFITSQSLRYRSVEDELAFLDQTVETLVEALNHGDSTGRIAVAIKSLSQHRASLDAQSPLLERYDQLSAYAPHAWR